MENLAPRPYSDTPTSASGRSPTSPPTTFPDFPSRFQDARAPPSELRSAASPRSGSRRAGGPGRVQFEDIPPPITSSVLLRSSLSPVGNGVSRPSAVDGGTPSSSRALRVLGRGPLSAVGALSRREKALQADLQQLLDAQSLGLVRGRTGRDVDHASDGGSSTPTSQSAFLEHGGEGMALGEGRLGRVVPVRQPRKKPVSLRAARWGILASMQELGTVKAQKESIVNSSMTTLQTLLRQVSDWSKKLDEFGIEMSRIRQGAESREVSELQNEKSAVETEIHEVEERLLALRARDRHLGGRIEELENQREAKFSSFREGQRGVDAEVKSFLFRPPVQDIAVVLEDAGRKRNEADLGKGVERDDAGEMFLTLPPKRRTLDMARSWLDSSISTLSSQSASILKERAALQEGAQLWDEAISLVTSFEDDLRAQMKKGGSAAGSTTTLKEQVSKMNTVIAELQDKMERAESEGWNLLICAMGAELEAFREGMGILHGVLETLEGPASPRGDDLMQEGEAGQRKSADEATNGAHDLDELSGSNVTIEGLRNAQPAARGTGIALASAAVSSSALWTGDGAKEVGEDRSESEDDGPHPDLLVSQEEEDGDGPHPDLLVSHGVEAEALS
ncbi:MAG: hypothetical protein M1818_007449 [Claussenomyces sp. TS43310]|nr:MAG: hypothetical protein M1818_007449 [Claussenomyces sp. TS43310]